MLALGLQLVQACLDFVAVETGWTFCCRFQRKSVVLGGEAWLAQVIEADSQIEEVIRIVTIGGDCIEIGLLCFRPAALARVEVTECKIERW